MDRDTTKIMRRLLKDRNNKNGLLIVEVQKRMKEAELEITRLQALQAERKKYLDFLLDEQTIIVAQLNEIRKAREAEEAAEAMPAEENPDDYGEMRPRKSKRAFLDYKVPEEAPFAPMGYFKPEKGKKKSPYIKQLEDELDELPEVRDDAYSEPPY